MKLCVKVAQRRLLILVPYAISHVAVELSIALDATCGCIRHLTEDEFHDCRQSDKGDEISSQIRLQGTYSGNQGQVESWSHR